jgi:hypothetical protein
MMQDKKRLIWRREHGEKLADWQSKSSKPSTTVHNAMTNADVIQD